MSASHVVNSVDKTKSSDYVIINFVLPSRVPFLFFFFLFDFSKALTNAIVPYPTSISITETRNEI